MTKSLISGKQNATKSNDTTIEFQNPAFRDEMTDLTHAHAQTAIRQGNWAELDAFLGKHDDADAQDRRNVVRNGYQPERQVPTGVGPVSVQLPETRDRAGQGRCFRSSVLAPHLKKIPRLEAVLRWLYLKSVSANDFDEALTALFGESARGLSPSTISRLESVWRKDPGALRKVFPETGRQRCWVHKTANVLDELPKRVQPQARSMIHEIWQGETLESAEKPV